jgi:hypothetical protein
MVRAFFSEPAIAVDLIKRELDLIESRQED